MKTGRRSLLKAAASLLSFEIFEKRCMAISSVVSPTQLASEGKIYGLALSETNHIVVLSTRKDLLEIASIFGMYDVYVDCFFEDLIEACDISLSSFIDKLNENGIPYDKLNYYYFPSNRPPLDTCKKLHVLIQTLIPKQKSELSNRFDIVEVDSLDNPNILEDCVIVSENTDWDNFYMYGF